MNPTVCFARKWDHQGIFYSFNEHTPDDTIFGWNRLLDFIDFICFNVMVSIVL